MNESSTITRHHTRVEPIRLRVWDAALGVEVVRVVGYRWRCDCGERGGYRRAWAAAYLGGREHWVPGREGGAA